MGIEYRKVKYGEHTLDIVIYDGELYRADRATFTVGKTGANDYSDPRITIKYFTTDKDEVEPYVSHGLPFVKTWKSREPLVLLDIFKKGTREALKALIGARALNVAFPLNKKGNVYRVSEEGTKHLDDEVLNSICRLGIVDGYYMPRQEQRNGVGTFHSEIGLCRGAFGKIVLVNSERSITAPPPPPERKRRHKYE